MPAEADPPLIIDPDTVLTDPIALELLQAIARRRAEVLELFRRIQHHELSEHQVQELSWKAANPLPLEEALGIATREALDHLV